MHLRKDEGKQVRQLYSNPHIPVQGSGRRVPVLTAQGTRRDQLWTRHPSIAGCTHLSSPPHPRHSDWDNLDTPIHLNVHLWYVGGNGGT